MSHPSLDFGWGRKPMREQLANTRVDPVEADHLDKDASAIIRLHMRGIITDSECRNAVRRATKRIETITLRKKN